MEELTNVIIQDKLKKRLNRLFYWAIAGFSLFLFSWIASSFRHLFGFDPHWAGDNFAFNVMFLFPATMVSVVILFFTGGLTLGYWKTLPNLTKKVVTVVLSYGVLLFVGYVFLMVFRQH